MMRRPPVWVVVTAIVVLVTAVTVVALRSDHGSSARGAERAGLRAARPAASTTTTVPAPTTSGDAPPPDTGAGSPPFPVDRLDVTLVDPELDGRSVPVAVWYPLRGGPAPLVVFAHGFATVPDTYETFLAGLASTGLVVVAPRSYPTRFYNGGGEAPPSEPDPEQLIAVQPGDDEPGEPVGEPSAAGDEGVSFDFDDQRRDIVAAIDVMLGPDVPLELRGRITTDRVGVIGHSDGGVSAAAVAFNSAVGDGRVGAAVIVSGSYGYFGGSWFPEGSPALLALHGDADGVNPFASSIMLFDADNNGPKYLVEVHGAGHLDLLLEDPSETAVVGMIHDFLTGYLRDDAAARQRVQTDADGALLDLVAAA